jgi:hypothetical protein
MEVYTKVILTFSFLNKDLARRVQTVLMIIPQIIQSTQSGVKLMELLWLKHSKKARSYSRVHLLLKLLVVAC